MRGYEPRARDTASRSDSGSSPETPSVNGTRKMVSYTESKSKFACVLLIALCVAGCSNRPHPEGGPISGLPEIYPADSKCEK